MEKNEQVMSRDEKIQILSGLCSLHGVCEKCPLGKTMCSNTLWCDMQNDELDTLLKLIPSDQTEKAKHILDNAGRDNQRAKADYGKEQLTLVPRRIIHDICAIRMYGNEKYPDGGPDNWKKVARERYRDAAYRHFLAYLDDPQGKDKESGFPHLWHLACNIAFLCEFEDECVQPEEKDGLHCKHCLYFDEDEDGEHCSECKYAHVDNFVRRTH